MEKEKINLDDEILFITNEMIKVSEGKLELLRKCPSCGHCDELLNRFFYFNGEKIGNYSFDSLLKLSKADKISHGLSTFLVEISLLKFDCKESFEVGMNLLQKLGNKVIDRKYIDNWNLLFK